MQALISLALLLPRPQGRTISSISSTGASARALIKGGTEMTDEELAAAGANKSMTHVDFMFGSRQMHIEGICQDGSTVTVFDHGNFVF